MAYHHRTWTVIEAGMTFKGTRICSDRRELRLGEAAGSIRCWIESLFLLLDQSCYLVRHFVFDALHPAGIANLISSYLVRAKFSACSFSYFSGLLLFLSILNGSYLSYFECLSCSREVDGIPYSGDHLDRSPIILHRNTCASISKNQEEASDSYKHGSENQQEVIHLHNRGVAARVLHLSREVEKTTGSMRAIKEALGDNDDEKDDVAALRREMQGAGMSANVWKHALRELRLNKMQPQLHGYNSSRVYLEFLADLPWQKASEERELDLKAAKERLDNDHYGLAKVKQGIIEYLAVCKMLCFVGPPGYRISLGVMRDEADIRGHRLTCIGSMPGLLVDGLKRVGVYNPVMLLDEIDKTGSDVRGDSAASLLEVLDPELNKTFNDHYLNLPFDLSKVIFVAAANRVQPIPPPLLDRMEVIELPGYTPEEKLRIEMWHLIPRILEQHGLSFDVQQWASPLLDGRLAGEGEVEMEVIPIGVNNHDISNAFRVSSPFIVDEAMLEKVLGSPRYDDREAANRVANAGVFSGLARTLFRGEVQSVEVTAWWEKVRASAPELKLVTSEESNLLQGRDIHIHLPAGAVPKKGPSAGVTIATALVSLFSQRRVRADTAMTGEMTLTGLEVLPVGGIMDKRVILPESNLEDLSQVPFNVRSSLERMEDVLEQAFKGGCPLR
ncbi:Endopeptidase La [Handroanthus impetiginosus]|uniref:Endopeptidase La n=1 Tax=Handroanthus impetiginosus TaxID=429701 RepID=A0A2G9HC84_9LAMI|nr:Endopeptidase La [Handroanthus impetiginosus]